MKKISSYCLFLIIIFAMQSCKKDPGGTFYAEPEPVFSVAAKFGISDVLIEAGRNDFYMFTSYEFDSLDVLVFKGELSKLETCLMECEESISISIRDYKVFDEETSNTVDISEIKSVDYGFVGTETDGAGPTAYEISFTNRSFSSEGGPSDVTWSYLSLVEVFENSFTDIFAAGALADGIPISLTTVYGNGFGCTNTYEKVINTDFQTDCFHEIDFNIVPKGDGVNYQVLPYNTDMQGLDYTWDDSSFGEDTLTIMSPGTYCLTLTNSYGCTGERCVSIVNLNKNPDSIQYCFTAFSYEVTPLETPGTFDTFDFSKVLITYTSAGGIEYRSDRSSQPESSFFIVESLDDYDSNEFKEATIKLDAKFRVVLYNDSGEGVLMDAAEGTIGVAIPD